MNFDDPLTQERRNFLVDFLQTALGESYGPKIIESVAEVHPTWFQT